MAVRGAILLTALAAASLAQQGNLEPLGPPPVPPPDPRLYQTFRVRVSGGGFPGKPAHIDITCNGHTVVSNYTDEKGILITRVESGGPRGQGEDASLRANFFGACRTEVTIPGFRSDPQDPFLLHPIGAGEGWAISFTAYKAPEKARRAYTAGTEAAYKRKWDAAKKQFDAALKIYPEYASAWYQLGVVYEEQNKRDEAREALQKAVQIDSRFLLPYVHMAQIAAAEGRWTEVERISNILLPMNPVEAPEAYFYHASAKLRLNHAAEAEASARKAVEIDMLGRRPEFRYLAGQVMAALGKRREAAVYFREYLKMAPNASDADRVRAYIERLE